MGIQLEDTPSAVRNNQRRRRQWVIVDIDKNTEERHFLRVEIVQPGQNVELHVAENGRILHDSRRSQSVGAPARQVEPGSAQGTGAQGEKLTYGEVPAAVQNRIRATDDDTRVKQIQRTIRDGKRVYDVELEKGGKAKILSINDDGTILEKKDGE
jgi:uncharacterized membrane protein YkoI